MAICNKTHSYYRNKSNTGCCIYCRHKTQYWQVGNLETIYKRKMACKSIHGVLPHIIKRLKRKG